MRNFKAKLLTLSAFFLLGSAFVFTNTDALETRAQADPVYSIVEYGLASHNRTNTNLGEEQQGYRINWNSASFDNPTNTGGNPTIARIAVEVADTGTYPYTVTVSNYGEINFRHYVNSVDNYIDAYVGGGNWEATEGSVTTNIELQAGRNIIVSQWRDWGLFKSFSFPASVKVLPARANHRSGVYEQSEFIFTRTRFVDPATNIFDSSIIAPVFNTFDVDENYEFEGSAVLFYTPSLSTTALDVVINNKGANAGELKVRFGAHDGSAIQVSPSEEIFPVPVGQHIVRIPESVYSNYANYGAENYLRFSSVSGDLQLLKMYESSETLSYDFNRLYPTGLGGSDGSGLYEGRQYLNGYRFQVTSALVDGGIVLTPGGQLLLDEAVDLVSITIPSWNTQQGLVLKAGPNLDALGEVAVVDGVATLETHKYFAIELGADALENVNIDFSLKLLSDAPEKERLRDFLRQDALLMNSYTDNQCLATYAIAKDALFAKGYDTVQYFKNYSGEDAIQDAKNRYEAWSIAAGDPTPYVYEVIVGSAKETTRLTNKNLVALAIILAGSLTIGVHAAVIAKRRRSLDA